MVEIDFGLKLECTQKTFQRCFNVVIWFTWHHNEGQRQINIETTLCISALECTTSSNVEPTLCISMLIWTILDYLETTLSFSTSSFTTLVNVETMLWKWAFPKRTKKKSFQNEYTEFKVSIIFLLPMLREMCWRNLAKQQKFLKDHEKYCTART